MNEQPRVTYDVKDLLERMDRKLERIDEKLDAKADLQMVVGLQRDHASLLERFNAAETQRAAREKQAAASFTKREKLAALLAAFLLVALNAAGTLRGWRIP